MKKRMLICTLVILAILVIYEACGFIITRSCVSRAVKLKEGNETIEDTNDPLWSAQYHPGSHDSASVEVTVVPLFITIGPNEGKSHMLVTYHYYDAEGNNIMTSAPENEVFYYKKVNGTWELERIHRKA